ncbi:hypothetical protein [Hymenobacter psychrotolerans]|uniref:Uncharacterized protein n=1 Tax=Hymenobacter psychrotolerans DSM 18569 TaxID=1121959 RepID=A0A1M7EFJ8_9BACT|nr:hypothetical protein [Hymenobacter psychrotolerans]SHL90555.1 hypothetical protein SAMN02746009_03594 [Hymenobacter psychrotolerans DSM 18569]
MTYYEWNNLIGDLLFKTSRVNQEVFLFLSREQIVEAAWPKAAATPDEFNVEEGESLTGEHIWRTFLACVRSGPVGVGGQKAGIVQRAYNCYKQWEMLREKGDTAGSRLLRQNGSIQQVRYPAHLTYLILLTMPLGGDTELRDTRGYYKILDKWLRSNALLSGQGEDERKLQQDIYSLDDRKGWQAMWQVLETWSLGECGGQQGIVRSRASNWLAWPYVSWPLAQCLLSPRVLQQLRQFFVNSNLAPNMVLSGQRMRELLLRSKPGILDLPKLTRESLSRPDNELGKSVVEMVLGLFRAWDGSSNFTKYRTESSSGRPERIVERGDAAAELLPFLQLDRASKRVSWQHRVRIRVAVPLPDDLQLVGENYSMAECHTATPGWSTPLPGLSLHKTHRLEDNRNRWHCVYQPADIQLFVLASRYHLPYWAPVSVLEQGTEMLLLCRDIRQAYGIRKWGESFQTTGVFQELVGYSGLPDGYSLFKLKNPVGICPELNNIPAAENEGRIVAEGGLAWEYRRYLADLPPAFRLFNTESKQPLFIRYDSDGDTASLLQDAEDGARWLLPVSTRCNDTFVVVAPGRNLSSDGLRYTLTQAVAKVESRTIRRGPYNDDLRLLPGEQAVAEGDVVYYDGHRLSLSRMPVKDPAHLWALPPDWGANPATTLLEKIKLQTIPYDAIFTPVAGTESHTCQVASRGRDGLLHLLTTKGRLTLEEFSRAYDAVWLDQHPEGRQQLPTVRQKRSVMRLYAQMGFGDYGYRRNGEQITSLPPYLLPLPTKEAATWRMLLTGGRTPALLAGIRACISEQTPEVNIQIIGPEVGNDHLLLPDSVILTAPAHSAEETLETLAQKCGIQYAGFGAKVPAELVLFAGSLTQYRRTLVPSESYVRDGWRKLIFNPATLEWDDVEVSDIAYKQQACLVEYQLSDFERRYAWWYGGQPHRVDKNWGRYLALQAAGKRVIRHGNGEVLVPVLAPLPDLLAKALVLLSGQAPAASWRDVGGVSRKCDVYRQPGAGLLIHRIIKHLNQD